MCLREKPMTSSCGMWEGQCLVILIYYSYTYTSVKFCGINKQIVWLWLSANYFPLFVDSSTLDLEMEQGTSKKNEWENWSAWAASNTTSTSTVVD